MGVLKEKYTTEYFTGRDKEGNNLKYGATSCRDENGNYVLREQDECIVKKINFSGRRVLEFGFGRGEVARYAVQHNAEYYEGVDFSPAAFEIALDVTKNCIPKPIFHNEDALEFIRRISGNTEKKFDIIIMFDFIEHIPRDELHEIFIQLHNVIGTNAIIVINTPAYKYDNDVIKYGLDNRNNKNTLDTSDLLKETAGMHCNKYSIISLQKFMKESGFINISEMHFYISERKDLNKHLYQSYYDAWTKCLKSGYPILGIYVDDVIEYSYIRDIHPVWSRFDCGEMEGIELLTTEVYKDNIYSNGEYDSEVFMDFVENCSNVNVVYDVGGFVGVSSLMFAKCMNNRGNVITFEPNPWNSNRILLNLSHNSKISNCIFLLKNALGEKEHVQQMLMSENIDQGYSSTSRIESSHSKIANNMLPDGFFEQDVFIRTLDNVVDETGIIPDVIKVDIEGAEHLFLLGAQKTLKKYKPILYIEFHSEFCAFECTRLLMGLGYLIEVLHEEDDNRLMIKASHDYESVTDINLTDISINSFTSSMNLQRESLNILKKCNSILDNKISYEKMSMEKDDLQKQNTMLEEQVDNFQKQNTMLEEQVDNFQKQNAMLEEQLGNLQKQASELKKIYASRGWKVLKIGYKVKSRILHK